MRRILIPVAVTAATAALAAGWLLRVGYRHSWTGFGDKKLWDWLHLLIVPTVLGSALLWFNFSQSNSEQEIAVERTREDALQAYLDRMSELLLDRKLGESAPQSEVREVARARTLTVLRRLDGERKGILLRFLRESELIVGPGAVVDLGGADLQGAYLHSAQLSLADLGDANLRGAVLWFADLSGADLKGADLTGAQLWFANLKDADLTGANLTEAELTGADLKGANLAWANLKLADLKGADLSRANLKDSVVTPAQLTQARTLSGAIGQSGGRYE